MIPPGKLVLRLRRLPVGGTGNAAVWSSAAAERGRHRRIGRLRGTSGAQQAEPVHIIARASSLILPGVHVEATDPADRPGATDGFGARRGLRGLADAVGSAG